MALTTAEVGIAGIAGTLAASAIAPLIALRSQERRLRHERMLTVRQERRIAYSDYLAKTNAVIGAFSLAMGRAANWSAILLGPAPNRAQLEQTLFEFAGASAVARVVGTETVRTAMRTIGEVLNEGAECVESPTKAESKSRFDALTEKHRAAVEAFLQAVDEDLHINS
jgi:hypothetical protein